MPSPSLPRLSPPSLKLPTPVRIDRLEFLLSGYIHSIAEFISSGFRTGFPLHSVGVRESADENNLISARQNPGVVDTKIIKELEAGRLAGPFPVHPFSPFRISPLGVVPKKTQHIKAAGWGCFLAKTDIQNAFRIIPIRPQDYSLLGMRWRDSFYYDRCMPMGCSSSCKTFETLSTALEWIAQKKFNITCIIHLLDDFLIIAKSHTLCQDQLHSFLDLCSFLCILISPAKTCVQLTHCHLLVLNWILFPETRLPLDKLDKCLVAISHFLTRKKVTLKEIQSLTGLLNSACSVVLPGRAFLRRLIDLTLGLRSPHHYLRLNGEVKADLQIWQSFLTSFNGRTFFLEDTWYSSDKLKCYTDAAGALGFGAVFGSRWCYGKWPDNWF